ncbi:hypothetical protein EES41_36765 (plasmid) [Streptomyces sp. ADI95-16]|nr:hypothetical protein EES41_36765 [Streptomyces sp. ADI95-16]
MITRKSPCRDRERPASHERGGRAPCTFRGPLHRRRTPRRVGGFRRGRADRERSARLLKAIGKADEVAEALTGKPGGLSEFERIVLHGVARVPGREYPPAGHGYPRP